MVDHRDELFLETEAAPALISRIVTTPSSVLLLLLRTTDGLSSGLEPAQRAIVGAQSELHREGHSLSSAMCGVASEG